jgi:cytochrome c-type biogenesis protein CcmH/NrfG
VRLNPRLHEAFSSLGYAYRKTGDFDQALQAYERALVLAPGYAAAIEYQAEAHLGLNRTTETQ